MKQYFPWIASGLGVLFTLLLVQFSPLQTNGGIVMPLLTTLLMSELGFLATLAGAVMSALEIKKQGLSGLNALLFTANLFLAGNLLRMGMAFWSATAGV